MFYIERIISLAVYCIAVLVVFLAIEATNISQKSILFGYTIFLSILGFFFIPTDTKDLYRINETMVKYANYDFKEFYKNVLSGSYVISADVLYWLIGKTGCLALLPAINSFVCYSCIFHTINKTAEIYSVNRRNSAVAVLFLMSVGTYIFVISGIRTMLGISLLVFCFFRETIEKKFNIFHLLLYLIAALLHQFIAVLCFARIIIGVVNQKSFLLKITLFIVLGIILYVSRDLLEGWFANIQDKGLEYIGGKVSFSQPWGYVIGTICGLIVCSILFKFMYVDAVIKKKFKSYKFYLLACLFGALIFSFEYSIFHRLITYIVPIIALPFLMLSLEHERKRKRFNYKSILTLVSYFLLFLSCWQGALGALQFFIF